MAAMWARFVDTSMIYSGVVNEARRFGYQGNCPLAESVAERLITLPNYASLTGQDVDNVAQVFLSSLTAFRRAGSEPAPRAELTPAGSNF
jgi:dTDP-4-amino-4,6-dideoxygalactose transaminase